MTSVPGEAPTERQSAGLLLGVTDPTVPRGTLVASVIIFVVPLTAGLLTDRRWQDGAVTTRSNESPPDESPPRSSSRHVSS